MDNKNVIVEQIDILIKEQKKFIEGNKADDYLKVIAISSAIANLVEVSSRVKNVL